LCIAAGAALRHVAACVARHVCYRFKSLLCNPRRCVGGAAVASPVAGACATAVVQFCCTDSMALMVSCGVTWSMRRPPSCCHRRVVGALCSNHASLCCCPHVWGHHSHHPCGIIIASVLWDVLPLPCGAAALMSGFSLARHRHRCQLSCTT